MTAIPTVSVVVPSYNHARFLRKRLDTILAQTFQDFELILLDDSSTDESQAILREYGAHPKVTHVEFNQANSGSTFKQWNKGVRLAAGKYVWIAESDDYSDPQFLGRTTALVDANRNITFAYCRSRQVLADGALGVYGDSYMFLWDPERWTADFCIDGREMCQRYFARTNPVPNASGVVFRKQAYEQTGGADENFRICGDWKLWAGMALQGRVAYAGDVLNYFRDHPNSVRNQTRIGRRDVLENLDVTRWVLDRVTVGDVDLEEIRALKASFWVAALTSLHVPLSVKRQVLRRVRALDQHPVRRALRPALVELRLKLRRHWRELKGQPA